MKVCPGHKKIVFTCVKNSTLDATNLTRAYYWVFFQIKMQFCINVWKTRSWIKTMPLFIKKESTSPWKFSLHSTYVFLPYLSVSHLTLKLLSLWQCSVKPQQRLYGDFFFCIIMIIITRKYKDIYIHIYIKNVALITFQYKNQNFCITFQ